MVTKLSALFAALSLFACIGDDGEDLDDLELSETEHELGGTTYLTFASGHGEQYLSPMPPERTGVADGMVGWIETETYSPLPGIVIRKPAFKTNGAHNTGRWGHVFLDWYGTVPGTPGTGALTCTLSAGALLVDGSTYVKGHNPFPYLGGEDAYASATVIASGMLGYSYYPTYRKVWYPGTDATKSETRNKFFDKAYYLQNGPSFTAYPGQHFELEIELQNYAWESSEGEASVSIYQFGFLATGSANIVKLQCS
jgi:hypothetical protein